MFPASARPSLDRADARPRYTLQGTFAAVTAAALSLGVFRHGSSLAWSIYLIVASLALFAAVVLLGPEQADGIGRRPCGRTWGICCLVVLAAHGLAIELSAFEPAIAIVALLAAMIGGVCIGFQRPVAAAVLVVIVLWLPLMLVVILAIGVVGALFAGR